MSSIVRPTPAQRTRRLIVLAAAVFAVVVPLVQNLAGLGLTQAEFAADGNTTLRVAGYAFAIWSLIYLGLMAYAIRQALPQTGESPLISRMVRECGIEVNILSADIRQLNHKIYEQMLVSLPVSTEPMSAAAPATRG